MKHEHGDEIIHRTKFNVPVFEWENEWIRKDILECLGWPFPPLNQLSVRERWKFKTPHVLYTFAHCGVIDIHLAYVICCDGKTFWFENYKPLKHLKQAKKEHYGGRALQHTTNVGKSL